MIHHVYANRSNIGDWLSALGIQSQLGTRPVIEHLCDDPFVPDTLERLAELTEDDLLIIGGGGLLMDYFEPFWRGFEAISRRVPFCIWGVGFCDIKREPSRPSLALLRRIVSRARVCSVRDELTRRLLELENVPPPIGCPSLCVIDPPPAAGWGVLHVDNYTTAGADVYDAMEADARAFAEETGRPLRRTNNRIEGREHELRALLDRYAACDVVLSSALHGCIIAAMMGKKLLAVSGDYKIEQFMESAALGEWVISNDDVSTIPARLRELHRQKIDVSTLQACRAAHSEVARSLAQWLTPVVKQ